MPTTNAHPARYPQNSPRRSCREACKPVGRRPRRSPWDRTARRRALPSAPVGSRVATAARGGPDQEDGQQYRDVSARGQVAEQLRGQEGDADQERSELRQFCQGLAQRLEGGLGLRRHRGENRARGERSEVGVGAGEVAEPWRIGGEGQQRLELGLGAQQCQRAGRCRTRGRGRSRAPGRSDRGRLGVGGGRAGGGDEDRGDEECQSVVVAAFDVQQLPGLGRDFLAAHDGGGEHGADRRQDRADEE